MGIPMIELPVEVRSRLVGFRDTQQKLLSHYESAKQYEMCYVVQWSILEHAVKEIAIEYRKVNAIENLTAWVEHFTAGAIRPKSVPNTTIEKFGLPQKNEFIAALEQFGLDADTVWIVMDSRGKHRRHRNEIAHTGKRFVNHLLYLSLIEDLVKAERAIYENV
jgi:hypothetical protein